MPKNTSINTEPFDENISQMEVTFTLAGGRGKIAERLAVRMSGKVWLANGFGLSQELSGLVHEMRAIDPAQMALLMKVLEQLWGEYRQSVSGDE